MGEIQLHIYCEAIILASTANILAEVIVNNNSAVAIVFNGDRCHQLAFNIVIVLE